MNKEEIIKAIESGCNTMGRMDLCTLGSISDEVDDSYIRIYNTRYKKFGRISFDKFSLHENKLIFKIQ